ncbi:MAG TPA: orotidine-5'-phosphate decarboxylase [Patescibacteria group bacterium]|nr:orotidine-5'-phosphate decarboxylase [Patescibacteria group bacterium]
MLEARWAQSLFVCVGLDSTFDKIPMCLHRPGNETKVDIANTIVAFNHQIVVATCDLVCAYKPNIAFYEENGPEGIAALWRTIADIHVTAPDVPVILDAKRGDIGSTNHGYVELAFNFLGADAMTIHPYFGAEANEPFLEQTDKGIIVLCRTSNKGAGEFQDLVMAGRPLYLHVAEHVANDWNTRGNCAVVVGATFPDELRKVRDVVGDMPILIPGIGVQGGDVEKTVLAGKDSHGCGIIINSSRGIIYASNGADFADVARLKTMELSDQINQYR